MRLMFYVQAKGAFLAYGEYASRDLRLANKSTQLSPEYANVAAVKLALYSLLYMEVLR